MTIFPEHPYLIMSNPNDGIEMRRLAEDHLTIVKVIFGWSLMILVKAGYETDGATVSLSKAIQIGNSGAEQVQKLIEHYYPGEDAKSVFDHLVGTPWDLPRLLAAIVHDALYSMKWMCRFLCDRVYKWILEETEYAGIRRDIEYDLIRLLGWRNWNAVSKEERKWAQNLVVIKWVRTKKVLKEIERLKNPQKGK